MLKHFFKKEKPASPQQNEHKKRKKRSDAKHDTKIMISAEDKKILQRHAIERGVSLTALASQAVENWLYQETFLSNYKYDDAGVFVHIMLDKQANERLQNAAIEWGVSKRKAAHRIIKDYIYVISGGVRIIPYNKNSGNW